MFGTKIPDKAEQANKFRFANKVRSVLPLILSWGLEYEYGLDPQDALALPRSAVTCAEINTRRNKLDSQCISLSSSLYPMR
ncbi:hypothetical protein JZX87_03500 [Agrobacterium sp. Ap1]|uniref:hypothetical protein n=1 Tax=Agrobacterium sp. Ap1 TaxID=2815337 RepID=UPI001A8C8248|nr:hypothetical protein [Agrobacterium sp. Ap1]MBO0140230.1 hypothetical protein [Agrobacterium sp. Ap1]